MTIVEMVQYAKNVKILSLNDLKDMLDEMEVGYDKEQLALAYYYEMYDIKPAGIERDYVITIEGSEIDIKLIAGEVENEFGKFIYVIAIYVDNTKVVLKKTPIKETATAEEIINEIEDIIYNGL